MRLEGNDSAGNSTGHSIDISIIYRLSKSVSFSLIALINMLTFWPRSTRSQYWLDSHCWTRTGTGTFQRSMIINSKMLILCYTCGIFECDANMNFTKSLKFLRFLFESKSFDSRIVNISLYVWHF